MTDTNFISVRWKTTESAFGGYYIFTEGWDEIVMPGSIDANVAEHIVGLHNAYLDAQVKVSRVTEIMTEQNCNIYAAWHLARAEQLSKENTC